MQIKRIADNIYAFSFLLTNKNLTKTQFIVEPSFFTSWTMRGSDKCARGARATKQNYISIYIYLYLKTGVYICICIYNPGTW